MMLDTLRTIEVFWRRKTSCSRRDRLGFKARMATHEINTLPTRVAQLFLRPQHLSEFQAKCARQSTS